MKNKNLGKFLDLETATKVSKEAVIYWLHGHLPKLNQRDLLSGFSFGCPCGACHASLYRLFTEVCRIVGKAEFKEVLKNLLLEHPHNVYLPETVYILLCWSKGQDIQGYLKPFSPIHPLTGINHLDTLDEEARKKMERHDKYINEVDDMETIVSKLEKLGINRAQLVDYQLRCHEEWLANYKPQMMSVKKQQKEDTFEKRFHAAMHGSIQNFRHHFEPETDRELLAARLSESDLRGMIPEIVQHFPKGQDIIWRRFGKRLMAEYELGNSGKELTI